MLSLLAFRHTTTQLATVGKALHTLSRGPAAQAQGTSTKDEDGVLDTPTIQNPLRITTSTPNHTILYMPSRLGTYVLLFEEKQSILS